MINSINLCMSCMREIGSEKKCPYCGSHVDAPQALPYLPVRTVVGNRYLVGRVLDRNGEGVTYIGWDLKNQKAVNIREFLPDTFTKRTDANPNLQVLLGAEATFAELRRSFEELWVRLAKLSGLSALIKVTDVIEDYGTSYAVYDHFDGISLRDFLLRSKTGYISWEKARALLMPTLQTLGMLHKNGIIHRGISPTTLVIGEDGKIKITGFSIGELRKENSHFTPQIFEGYAAVEQCGYNGEIGPWTDIYSFAAVLYRSLIGSDPIPSKERIANDRLMVPGKFAEMLPAYVINGLINALQILPQDRTRSVEQLRAELSASPVAPPQPGVQYRRDPLPPPVQAPQPVPAKAPKKKTSPAKIIIITMLVTILVCAGAFVGLSLTVFKDKINLNFMPGKKEETSASVSPDQMVEVPDVIGRSVSTITQNGVFKQNFAFDIEKVYDDNVASGYIISQNPSGGASVPKGTHIKLVVSDGKEKISLPDVTGKSYDEANQILTEAGFTVERKETSIGDYIDGQVVRMNLSTTPKYDRGTTVTLTVFVPITEPETTQREEAPLEPEEDNSDVFDDSISEAVNEFTEPINQ